MRFYDPRFAKDAAFRNFLFSQRMRHGVCQRVAKLKGNKRLRELEELVNQPGFEEELR